MNTRRGKGLFATGEPAGTNPRSGAERRENRDVRPAGRQYIRPAYSPYRRLGARYSGKRSSSALRAV